MRPLVTLEHEDPEADVLVVTNMWPDDENPVYGIFVARQTRALMRAGLRCDVLYVRGTRSSLAYPAAALKLALWSVTRRGRYRLVHVHAGETTLPARFFVGAPQIASYCGDDLLGDPGADQELTRSSLIRAWVLRQFSRLLAATITKSEEMERALPPSRQKLNSVIPNGVDEDVFKPGDRAAAREQLGWDQDEVIALFGATKPDIPRKRRWLAEAACERAAEISGRKVRLHIARKVDPALMPVMMNAADVLLHTSSLEGSPNIVKEALMIGLPVVATASGDIDELLERVEPSFVCDADADVLGQAIVDSAGKRSNGRDVASHLRGDRVAAQVLALYDQHARGGAVRHLEPASR